MIDKNNKAMYKDICNATHYHKKKNSVKTNAKETFFQQQSESTTNTLHKETKINSMNMYDICDPTQHDKKKQTCKQNNYKRNIFSSAITKCYKYNTLRNNK